MGDSGDSLQQVRAASTGRQPQSLCVRPGSGGSLRQGHSGRIQVVQVGVASPVFSQTIAVECAGCTFYGASYPNFPATASLAELVCGRFSELPSPSRIPVTLEGTDIYVLQVSQVTQRLTGSYRLHGQHLFEVPPSWVPHLRPSRMDTQMAENDNPQAFRPLAHFGLIGGPTLISGTEIFVIQVRKRDREVLRAYQLRLGRLRAIDVSEISPLRAVAMPEIDEDTSSSDESLDGMQSNASSTETGSPSRSCTSLPDVGDDSDWEIEFGKLGETVL